MGVPDVEAVKVLASLHPDSYFPLFRSRYTKISDDHVALTFAEGLFKANIQGHEGDCILMSDALKLRDEPYTVAVDPDSNEIIFNGKSGQFRFKRQFQNGAMSENSLKRLQTMIGPHTRVTTPKALIDQLRAGFSAVGGSDYMFVCQNGAMGLHGQQLADAFARDICTRYPIQHLKTLIKLLSKAKGRCTIGLVKDEPLLVTMYIGHSRVSYLIQPRMETTPDNPRSIQGTGSQGHADTVAIMAIQEAVKNLNERKYKKYDENYFPVGPSAKWINNSHTVLIETRNAGHPMFGRIQAGNDPHNGIDIVETTKKMHPGAVYGVRSDRHTIGFYDTNGRYPSFGAEIVEVDQARMPPIRQHLKYSHRYDSAALAKALLSKTAKMDADSGVCFTKDGKFTDKSELVYGVRYMRALGNLLKHASGRCVLSYREEYPMLAEMRIGHQIVTVLIAPRI